MEFMKSVFEACKRVAIIDTLFSVGGTDSHTWNDKKYWGQYTQEHDQQATAEEQLKQLWYSIGNWRSFRLTRASLQNLFRHVGFTSAYECLNPYEYTHPDWPKETPNNTSAAVGIGGCGVIMDAGVAENGLRR